MSVRLTSIHKYIYVCIIFIHLKCNMFVRVLQFENEWKQQVRNFHPIDCILFDDYRKACRTK